LAQRIVNGEVPEALKAAGIGPGYGRINCRRKFSREFENA